MPATPTGDQQALEALIERLMREEGRTDKPEFFEDFAAETLMRDTALSPDELRRSKVDGANDGGIDFAFLLANGILIEEDSRIEALGKNPSLDVVLVSCTTSKSFKDTQVQKIADTVDDLVSFARVTPKLRRRYNEEVLNFFRRFRDAYRKVSPRDIRFRVVYAAASPPVSGAPEDRGSEIKENVNRSFSTAAVSVEFADAGRLYRLHHDPPALERPLHYEGHVIPTDGAFVCLVRLDQFVDFVTDDDRLQPAMLEANVRDYQGNITVNEAIRETLASEESTEFWWLNNGVTILASEALIRGVDNILITQPQIVNGLQTTVEIFNHFSRHHPEGETRHFLVRIIKITDAPLRDQIIRATNSQTAIQTASLWATDPRQQQIEDGLLTAGYYYDRRKNYYRNQGKPRDKIVTIPGMAQALTAMILLRPDHARARPSTLLKNRPSYEKVFVPSHSLDVYVQAVQLMEKVDADLKSRASLTAADRNNMRFHIAAALASTVGSYTSEDVAAFSAIDVDAIRTADLQRAFEVVQEAIDELVTPRMRADRVVKSQAILPLILKARRRRRVRRKPR